VVTVNSKLGGGFGSHTRIQKTARIGDRVRWWGKGENAPLTTAMNADVDRWGGKGGKKKTTFWGLGRWEDRKLGGGEFYGRQDVKNER